jgi:hypothetical protein
MKAKENELRPVERLVEEYSQVYKTINYPVVLYISVALVLFGLLGVAWAIPFPHIGFLGKYNGNLNWASFLIAGLIYYYLRLSPMMSYLMLFVLFACSFGIIQLEQWEKAGGLPLHLVSMMLLAVGGAGQIMLYSLVNVKSRLQLLVNSTVWMFAVILKGIKLKY